MRRIIGLYIMVLSIGTLSGEPEAIDLSSETRVPDTIHLRWNIWPEVERGTWDAHMQRFFIEKKFIFGVSTAEYQISGADKLIASQFARWESKTGMQGSGDACNGWESCVEDIALLKKLGVRSYRFSVDWSAVEPQKGQWNEQALDHYRKLCSALVQAGIEPMVTLHHFVHPEWFEVLGGFEKEKNIADFVRFCEKVFTELAPFVELWCTINEPGVYILQGYVRGVYPPGRSVPGLARDDVSWIHAAQVSRHNLGLAGVVLRNLLQAHVAVYWRLHELYEQDELSWHGGYKKPKVGFAHQYLKFDRFHTYPLGLVEAQLASVLNAWTNYSILEFFKTGMVPSFTYLGTTETCWRNPRAPQSFDFFGLNYYASVFLDIFNPSKPAYYAEDIKTDMPYSVYAEGFYQALKHVASLFPHVPIYVTENGVADANDTIRQLWTQRYIAAMYCAMQEGVDVRGYYYWSLMDNFEWDMGYDQKFGLYQVDNIDALGGHKTRTLRRGAHWFQRLACVVRDAAA